MQPTVGALAPDPILARDLVDALPMAIIVWDESLRIVTCNPACASLFPTLAPRLRPGESLEGLLRFGLSQGEFPDAGIPFAALEAWLQARIEAFRAIGPSQEIWLASGRWIQIRRQYLPGGRILSTGIDVTGLKTAEEQARRRSEEDPLTGLANRALFLRRLSGLTEGRRAGDALTACLLLIDLDHFKAVNDSLGHPAGDMLLRQVAARARKLMRGDDVMARLGGDEFAILLPGIGSPSQAISFIGRLRAAVELPVGFAGRKITPSLSVGAALFPDDGPDADMLMRSADAALYESKRDGRRRHTFFDRSIAASMAHKARMADALRKAIACEDIEIALQPQWHIASKAPVGFEALARWSDDEAAVSPTEFVAVAEEMGLILPLGGLVLRNAVAAIRGLLDRGPPPGRVAVNIAAAQLLAGDLPAILAGLLSEYRLPPHCLDIELTETTLLDRSAERIAQDLRALRRMGIGITLDNFGTGYASLAHLMKFPVDRLKIDRRFIRGLGSEETASPIARTVIGLAHSLGMEAVAEGVETEAQLQCLHELGCDLAQGYHLGRPMSVAAAADYLVSVQQLPAEGASRRTAGT